MDWEDFTIHAMGVMVIMDSIHTNKKPLFYSRLNDGMRVFECVNNHGITFIFGV